MISYVECKKLLKKYNFKNREMFLKFRRSIESHDIPKRPDLYYKTDWET
jgi:hypothetical protein